MNDLMTSAPCPRCGEDAAVGWAWAEDPPSARAVAYDCPQGCRLSVADLVARFPEMHDQRC